MSADPNSARINEYLDRVSIYDVEYTDTYDLPFWQQLTADVDSILELPCGSGVRALSMARQGKSVTAVDREPGMIDLLHEKLASEKRPLSLDAKVGDMRFLELGRTFDAILSVREAFQFLAEDDEIVSTLEKFSRHLSAEGFIAIDLADFDRSATCADYPLGYYDPEAPDGAWIDEWTRPTAAGGFCTRRRMQHRDASEIIHITFHYKHYPELDGRGEWYSSVRYRRHSYESFHALVDRSGLACERVYGDYRFKPYEAGDPRLIFIITQNSDGKRHRWQPT